MKIGMGSVVFSASWLAFVMPFVDSLAKYGNFFDNVNCGVMLLCVGASKFSPFLLVCQGVRIWHYLNMWNEIRSVRWWTELFGKKFRSQWITKLLRLYKTLTIRIIVNAMWIQRSPTRCAEGGCYELTYIVNGWVFNCIPIKSVDLFLLAA